MTTFVVLPLSDGFVKKVQTPLCPGRSDADKLRTSEPGAINRDSMRLRREEFIREQRKATFLIVGNGDGSFRRIDLDAENAEA